MVGTTEDITVSRMTIGLKCSDETFEQIKKQLNRNVDIIRVQDLTDTDAIKKELLPAGDGLHQDHAGRHRQNGGPLQGAHFGKNSGQHFAGSGAGRRGRHRAVTGQAREVENMTEIRWHGRGGQGAKTACLLLADVAFVTGLHVQGFPEYGPERMRAPITAYNRLDTSPITIQSNIYNPGLVVVDETLIGTVDA